MMTEKRSAEKSCETFADEPAKNILPKKKYVSFWKDFVARKASLNYAVGKALLQCLLPLVKGVHGGRQEASGWRPPCEKPPQMR